MKVSKPSVMKAFRGCGCIFPHIIYLITRQERVISFMLQPLCSYRKSFPLYLYLLVRRLVKPQSTSGHNNTEKNSLQDSFKNVVLQGHYFAYKNKP